MVHRGLRRDRVGDDGAAAKAQLPLRAEHGSYIGRLIEAEIYAIAALAGVEGRELARLVTYHGHAVGFQVLECTADIENRFDAGADNRDISRS
ncbi:hypothetical protein D3C86_1816540 [compost metagenome]